MGEKVFVVEVPRPTGECIFSDPPLPVSPNPSQYWIVQFFCSGQAKVAQVVVPLAPSADPSSETNPPETAEQRNPHLQIRAIAPSNLFTDLLLRYLPT